MFTRKAAPNIDEGFDRRIKIRQLIEIVRADYTKLEFIAEEDQVAEVIEAALETATEAIAYVVNPTDKEILKAVNRNGNAIKFISESRQTEEICLAAVRSITPKENPFFHIVNPSEKVILEAINISNGFDAVKILKKSKIKTFDICRAAIFKNPESITDTPEEFLTEKFLIEVIEDDDVAAYHIQGNFTEDFFKICIQKNPDCIQNFDKSKVPFDKIFTYENCLTAVQANWKNLNFVPHHFLDERMCVAAYDQNILALRFLYPEVKYDLSTCEFYRDNGQVVHWVCPDNHSPREYNLVHEWDRERRLSFSLEMQKACLITEKNVTSTTRKIDLL